MMASSSLSLKKSVAIFAAIQPFAPNLFDLFTSIVKPWAIRNFATFDSMDRRCKAVEQYLIVVLFVFQF